MRPKYMFFLLLSLVLLFIGGAGAVYYTVRANLDADLHAISTKQAELEAIDTRALLIKETRAKLAQYEEAGISERIDELLPTSKNQTQAIEQLFSIFNSQSIPIDTLQFAATEEQPANTSQSEASSVTGVWSIPITVNFNEEISYVRLKRLIAAVENSSRHLTLHDLQVQPVTAEVSNPGNVTVTMVIYVHYLANAESTASQSKEEILKKIEASTKGTN